MNDELDRIMKRRERNTQAGPLTLRQKLDELDALAQNSNRLKQKINEAYKSHEEFVERRGENDKLLESLKKDILYTCSPTEPEGE